MRSVNTSYAMYFNKKYKRVGPIFQGPYKAVDLRSDEHLLHISRYIHLNPDNYKSWEPSSLNAYLGRQQLSWLHPERITKLFSGPREYSDFLADYEGYKKSLDEIRGDLADH